MQKKITISIITVLLVVLISLANIPTASAYVPVGPPADPALDPTQVFFMDPLGMYSFTYGHCANYGSYLLDFQWLSPATGWERYMGMLSVPYFIVNGITYIFAVGGAAKAAVLIGPSHWQIVFNYMPIGDANGDIHTFQVIYDIWHTPPPPISPAPGTDLRIDILISDTVIWNGGPGGPWNFNAPIRADFDIADLVSPAMDDVYVWTGAPPAWTAQWVETAWPIPPPPLFVDPLYGLAVMQNDFVVSGAYPLGPWGAIIPFNIASDTFYLLANQGAVPWEYLGPPVIYNTAQSIGASNPVPPPPPVFTDIVVWDDMAPIIIPRPPNPGGMSSGTLNPQIWIV
jgi:hypothetical protein